MNTVDFFNTLKNNYYGNRQNITERKEHNQDLRLSFLFDSRKIVQMQLFKENWSNTIVRMERNKKLFERIVIRRKIL